MNLFNVWYVDGSEVAEHQTYWRSAHDSVEAAKREIELDNRWKVVFIERLK